MITFIASPLRAPDRAGYERHLRYARRCMMDSIDRGETPFVPHLLYTQVLVDQIKDEREKGIQLARRALEECSQFAYYIDFGISTGMKLERSLAERLEIPIFERKLAYPETFAALCKELGDEEVGRRTGKTERQIADARRGVTAVNIDFLYDLTCSGKFPGLDLVAVVKELGGKRAERRELIP